MVQMTLARVVGEARKAGFDNISIDLIYGLPGQTIAQWQDTLDKALSSIYPIIQGTRLLSSRKQSFII